MNPVDALRQLEERLHAELMHNPQYVALQGVRRTLKETVYILEEKENPSRPPSLPRVRERTNPPPVHVTTPANSSQADAAFAVLADSDTPLPIAEVVRRVRARGTMVGGNNPEMNLSSSLSRDGRFGSVRFEGRPCWVLKGKGYVSNTPMESVTENDRAELMGGDSAELTVGSSSADAISS